MTDVYRFPVEQQAVIDAILDEYGRDPKLREFLITKLSPMLWDRDVTLEDYLSNAPAIPSTGYDAMVIRGATTDAATRTYPTVFEAIRALDALGFATASIGVASRGSAVVETADLGARTTLTTVQITGVDGGGNDPINGGWSPKTLWSHGGFSTTGTNLIRWNLLGIEVQTGAKSVVAGNVFQGNNTSVWMLWSNIDASGMATSVFAPIVANNGSVLMHCAFQEVSPSLSIATACRWDWNTTGTLTVAGFVEHFSCAYGWTGATSLTFTVGAAATGTAKCIYMVGCKFGETSTAGSADALTFTTNGANNAVVITGAGDRGGTANLILAISNHSSAYLDVVCRQITLGAQTTNLNFVEKSNIGGIVNGALDVTGPCSLNVAAVSATLRGEGISGTLALQFTASSGTALSTVSLTDSAVFVSAVRHPSTASSTQKGYAVDAGSARCVIVFVGLNEFPTPSTNAGTTVRIITEAADPVALHASTHLPGSTDALTTAAAGTILPDDAAAVGTAASFARSDHKHAIDAAVAGSIQPDDAAAEGVSTSFSRADHKHSIVGDVAGAIQPDDAAAEGVSTSFSRADHKHSIVAAVAGAIAAGDAAAEGVATSFARSDHVHSSPATWPPRKFSLNLGDAVATSFNVDHTFGTLDVLVQVYDTATGETVSPLTVARTTTNRVVVTFTVAPGANAYRAVVIG